MLNVLSVILKGLDTKVASLQRAIIVTASTIVICNMIIEVVARFAFNTSIIGLEELTGHLGVWVYMIGAAYGSYDRSQIKAEFVHLLVKNERAVLALRGVALAVATVVASFLIHWSIDYVSWSIAKHEITPTLQIPTVIFQIPILIGAILMAIYFFVEMVELARAAYRHGRPNTEENWKP